MVKPFNKLCSIEAHIRAMPYAEFSRGSSCLYILYYKYISAMTNEWYGDTLTYIDQGNQRYTSDLTWRFSKMYMIIVVYGVECITLKQLKQEIGLVMDYVNWYLTIL